MEDTVYYRFEIMKRDGTKVKLKIREAKTSEIDTILDFMFMWYINEEAFVKCSGIPNSQEALREKRKLSHHLLTEEGYPALIVCLDNSDTLEIVACNLFYVTKRGKSIGYGKLFTTPECRNCSRIVEEISKVFDFHTNLDVETFLCGAGMCVDPSYRGCGIATELLRARKILMQRTGIPATGAWFTSTASQASAIRAGYKPKAEISFEELGRLTGVQFFDVPKMCVFSVLKAEEQK